MRGERVTVFPIAISSLLLENWHGWRGKSLLKGDVKSCRIKEEEEEEKRTRS